MQDPEWYANAFQFRREHETDPVWIDRVEQLYKIYNRERSEEEDEAAHARRLLIFDRKYAAFQASINDAFRWRFGDTKETQRARIIARPVEEWTAGHEALLTALTTIGDEKAAMILRGDYTDFDVTTAAIAAGEGRLDLIIYMYKKGCELDDTVAIYAAGIGHLDILKYVEDKIPFTHDNIFKNGAQHPQIEEWLVTRLMFKKEGTFEAERDVKRLCYD